MSTHRGMNFHTTCMLLDDGVSLYTRYLGESKMKKGNPAVHNGPAAAVSPRSGTRRLQTESPDPSLEKGNYDLHVFHFLILISKLMFVICM